MGGSMKASHGVIRTALLAIVVAATIQVNGAQQVPAIDSLMTAADFRTAGLQKLTPEELSRRRAGGHCAARVPRITGLPCMTPALISMRSVLVNSASILPAFIQAASSFLYASDFKI